MYLEKIKIHGFKSFGDGISLIVPKGITAIIGPNGSGKSNVSDAIRWVLGEQSAKSLRGNKMEDIIFAGTEKRRALGYAEVSLHIKDADTKTGIDYHEIVVKRRVYRSGESEYFINESNCRLKDIQELFMDTGIGKEGYSIIGQGQMDKVLSAKPEERRALFEEAAGIYKYKTRRIESEKKLEKQRANLVRVTDILLEIDKQLEPLEKEAEKTKEYLKLQKQLKTVEMTLFVHEVDELEKKLNQLKEQKIQLQEELNATYIDKKEAEKAYENWKQQKDQLQKEQEAFIQEVANLEKTQEKTHGQILVTKEKIESIDKLKHQLEKEKHTIIKQQEEYQSKIKCLDHKQLALNMERKSKHNQLTNIQEQYNECIENLTYMQEQVNGHKEGFYGFLREKDALQANIEKNEEIARQLLERKQVVLANSTKLNSTVSHETVHLQVLEKQYKELTSQQQSTQKLVDQLKQNKEKYELEKNQRQQQLIQVKEENLQLQKRLEWLKQMKREHEGLYQNVKQVMQLKDKKQCNGIIGVIGDLIEVPKQYEIAIATALGGAVGNVVTETEKYARDIIEIMKQKGIGKVTFLPLDTIQKSLPIQEKHLQSQVGFLGFANQLISYQPQYTHVISTLLERIIIVDTMENAARIAKKYRYRYRMVTLEGEVFHIGGSLSGGSTKNQKNIIFSRNREIKELEEKIITISQKQSNLEKELENISFELKHNITPWEQANNQIITLKEQIEETQLQIHQKKQIIALTTSSLKELEKEIEQLENKCTLLQNDKKQAIEKITKMQEELKQKEGVIIEEEKKWKNVENKKEIFSKQLTEEKVALANIEQQITYYIQQIQDIHVILTQSREKFEHMNQRIDALEKEKSQHINQEKELHNFLESLEQKIWEMQHKKEDYHLKKNHLEQTKEDVEQKNEFLQERLTILRERKIRVENQEEIIHTQKQVLHQNIWERYEITYTQALEHKVQIDSQEKLKDECTHLKTKIKGMGQINPNAVEEYAALQERQTFLEDQKKDIQKAEIQLLELIEQLTEQMKEIFEQHFQEIAKNFSIVFKEMFGGGEAYLQLTDHTNILESGIEIIAKPPGKKLQNMTLLSGGERSLTAISLLFGILQLKPSPFCVLDEIESALDDANVLRFANYLKKLARNTQFVVITHRKGTMESADTLYGVTMQERGVSKVLSIQLAEATDYTYEKTS